MMMANLLAAGVPVKVFGDVPKGARPIAAT